MLLRAVAHSKEDYHCWMPTCQHSEVSTIIVVAPFTPTTTTTTLANISPVRSVSCAHCHYTFQLVQTNLWKPYKCPHCEKSSSLGPWFARSLFLLFFGVIALGITIGITRGIVETDIERDYIKLLFIGGFAAAFVLLWTGFSYCRMRISSIEENTPSSSVYPVLSPVDRGEHSRWYCGPCVIIWP